MKKRGEKSFRKCFDNYFAGGIFLFSVVLVFAVSAFFVDHGFEEESQMSPGRSVPTVTLDFTTFFSPIDPYNTLQVAKYSFGKDSDTIFFSNNWDFRFYRAIESMSDPIWRVDDYRPFQDVLINVDSSDDGTIHASLHHRKISENYRYSPLLTVYNSQTQTYWTYEFSEWYYGVNGGQNMVRVSGDGSRIVAVIYNTAAEIETEQVYFFNSANSNPTRVLGSSLFSASSGFSPQLKKVDISNDGNLISIDDDLWHKKFVYDYSADALIDNFASVSPFAPTDYDLSESGNLLASLDADFNADYFQVFLHSFDGSGYSLVSEIQFPFQDLNSTGSVTQIKISEDESTLAIVGTRLLIANEEYKLILKVYDITNPSNPNLVYNFLDNVIATSSVINDFSVSGNGDLVAVGRRGNMGGGSLWFTRR